MADILTLSQFRNRLAQIKNSYYGRQSENSYFAQDNSGIVPILTLGRTYLFFNAICWKFYPEC